MLFRETTTKLSKLHKATTDNETEMNESMGIENMVSEKLELNFWDNRNIRTPENLF